MQTSFAYWGFMASRRNSTLRLASPVEHSFISAWRVRRQKGQGQTLKSWLRLLPQVRRCYFRGVVTIAMTSFSTKVMDGLLKFNANRRLPPRLCLLSNGERL